jgi:hypothetical protein
MGYTMAQYGDRIGRAGAGTVAAKAALPQAKYGRYFLNSGAYNFLAGDE